MAPEEEEETPVPSFATDVQAIFANNGCIGCHASDRGGLTLTDVASVSYANLVNVASPATGEIRVIPNNANDSYLVKKLEGRQSAGAQMPAGGPPLSSADLATIKSWINQGALNN
jgi:mono/diheme cytochrome c family protein